MAKFTSVLTAVLLTLLLTSCQAIGDIFSAGVWVGIVIVVIIIIVLIAIFGRKK